MVTSFDSLAPDVFEGATKGALEWTSEKIAFLVKKFKERKIAFIKEQKTIDIVKEQYASGEAKFYEKYIKDKEILLLLRMGLALRKLENDLERFENLRDKIHKKYKVQGLHIAEFVQNGMLNRYIGLLLETINSVEDVEKDIKEILKNIENHALFVDKYQKKEEVLKKTVIIITAHSPCIFVVAGVKVAAKTVRDCAGQLKLILKDYALEKFSTNEREILFFKRILKKV